MFTLITLMNSRSLHLDFGALPPQSRASQALGIPPSARNEDLFDHLFARFQSEGTHDVAQELLRNEHDLPSLGRLAEWQSNTLRQLVSHEFEQQCRSSDNPELVRAACAFAESGTPGLAGTLLASDHWQALEGFWLCTDQDLSWSAYTPRNNDEVRNRARALLGIENRHAPAADGVSFIEDEDISTPTRARLVEAMGNSRVAEATPALLRLLQGAHESLKAPAVRALGRIGSSSALKPLLELWDTHGGRLRPAIRDALSGFSQMDGASYLAGFIEANSTVTPSSAIFISDQLEMTPQLPVDWLIPLLQSPLADARRDAVVLLAVFGSETHSQHLQSVIALESDETVKTLAAQGAANLARCGRATVVELVDSGDE